MKKRADFMWALGPLYLSKGVKEGVYYLRVSARYVFGVASAEFPGPRAIMRLRSPALSDLQSWLGRQSTRLGKVLLEVK